MCVLNVSEGSFLIQTRCASKTTHTAKPVTKIMVIAYLATKVTSLTERATVQNSSQLTFHSVSQCLIKAHAPSVSRVTTLRVTNASQCPFCAEVHMINRLESALTACMGISCKMGNVFILLWELMRHVIITRMDSVTGVSRATI